MIYIKLLFAFIQIGALSFGGGYAALPVIQDVIVNQKGWLTISEMTDVVTISQLTPGPIAINAASFVGTKVAGVPGGIIATIGSVTPQTVLMIVLSYFLFRNRRLKIIDQILVYLRPGVIGLIGVAAASMLISSIFPNGFKKAMDFIGVAGFVVGAVLYRKKGNMIHLIGIGAALGLLLGLVEKFIL